jgi:hypothetical protein
LSYVDNQAAFNERKRLNVTPKKRRRGGGGGKGRKASSVKAGKKAVAKLTKQISALTTRVNDVEKKGSADDGGEEKPTDNDKD